MFKVNSMMLALVLSFSGFISFLANAEPDPQQISYSKAGYVELSTETPLSSVK